MICNYRYYWGHGAVVSDLIAYLNVRLELKLKKQMCLSCVEVMCEAKKLLEQF
jgi:hypothetical protein